MSSKPKQSSGTRRGKNASDFPFGAKGQPSRELEAPQDPAPCSFLELWQSKRGEREFPAKSDFSLSGMRQFAQHIYIVDVIDGGEDFRIRLFGTGVSQMLRKDYTGTLLSETPSELNWRGDIYRLAFRRRKPVFYLFELEPFGRETVVTENVILPVADASGELRHLICLSVELSPKHVSF